MDLQLAGLNIVVTGGSRGIGRETARVFIEEGANVTIVARDEKQLVATAGALGEHCHWVAADLTDQADIESLIASLGRVDVLVNNAGAIPGGRLGQLDDSAWRAGWELKVFGYVNLTRAMYPKLVESRGVVVNVIGAAGSLLPPEYVAGSAGNAALMAFTGSVAKTARLDGVRVVGINPGPVLTERLAALLARRDEPGLTDVMPFGRPAHPREIADAVAFLASPRSAYTNGSILTIDGAPTVVV